MRVYRRGKMVLHVRERERDLLARKLKWGLWLSRVEDEWICRRKGNQRSLNQKNCFTLWNCKKVKKQTNNFLEMGGCCFYGHSILWHISKLIFGSFVLKYRCNATVLYLFMFLFNLKSLIKIFNYKKNKITNLIFSFIQYYLLFKLIIFFIQSSKNLTYFKIYWQFSK